MLSDYIDAYIQAKKDGNKKEMQRIERDLSRLGMDKYSLLAIVDELEGER